MFFIPGDVMVLYQVDLARTEYLVESDYSTHVLFYCRRMDLGGPTAMLASQCRLVFDVEALASK